MTQFYSFYLFFLFPRLQAPGDSWGEIAADWFEAFVNDLWIEGLKSLSTTFWFLEKIGGGITRFLTEQDMWDLLLNTTMDSLSSTMPDILTNLMFSNNGAGGLIYLALMLAGILMIIPQTSHIRLVDPQQVIIWGVVVSVLFLSAASPWGYDLIGAVEQMRTSAVQVVLEAVDDDGELDSLIAQPMMANDTDLSDYSFILPSDFEEEYYPSPSEPDDYEERTAVISSFLGMEMTFNIETEASSDSRREAAEMGLAISGLTILPGVVLLMFGFIFATLTASALLLILFFIVSLPLGFFEFGSGILTGIVKQYTYLWAITLLAVILPGILIAAEALAYPDSSPPDPTEMMSFIPILIIVTIATSYVSAMATSAMTDTFSVISTSISTAMAPMNYAGSMPKSGTLEGLAGGAASVVGTAALAAVTGGAGAALMAGGGSLLSKTGGGETVGALATGLVGEKASVFATAAKGRGAAGTAQVAGAQNRQRKREKKKEEESAKAQFQKNTKTPTDEIPTEGLLQDAGAYQITNLGELDRAEEAYSAGEHVTARHHLTRAFGSREVASQALKEYDNGKAGMRKVRDMAQITQTTAKEMTAALAPIFDAKGQLSGEFRSRSWQNMKKRKSISNEDAKLAAAISGATVREPLDTWNDPLAADKLTQHVREDPTAEHPYSKDMSAAFALNDLAASEGWGERQLEALFEATKEGQVIALGGKKTGLQATTEQLRLHGEFDDSRPEAAEQGARLAMLILGQAKAPVARPRQNIRQVARGLTETVLNPLNAPLVPVNERTREQVEELNELANARGWEQEELGTLFETTLRARNEEFEGTLNEHITSKINFKTFHPGDPERAAALAVGIAAGTMPAPPEPPPRTTPTASELTQKALHPDSSQVLIRDEKTEKNLGKLNKLATQEGWEKEELQPIFQAAQAAQAAQETEETDHLNHIASSLHEQGIPVDDKKIRAADLALKIQGGVMLAPQVAQGTATARDKLEKQAAQTVLLETQQIQEQAPNWSEQEQQAGQTQELQTQQTNNEIQEQQTRADQSSLKERGELEKKQQERIITNPPQGEHQSDNELYQSSEIGQSPINWEQAPPEPPPLPSDYYESQEPPPDQYESDQYESDYSQIPPIPNNQSGPQGPPPDQYEPDQYEHAQIPPWLDDNSFEPPQNFNDSFEPPQNFNDSFEPPQNFNDSFETPQNFNDSFETPQNFDDSFETQQNFDDSFEPPPNNTKKGE